MPVFLVERNIPGASTLSDDEFADISKTSNGVVAGLGKPYTWHRSYVAGDKIYCIHEAENADIIRRHAREGGFPADLVVEVVREIGPETARRKANA